MTNLPPSWSSNPPAPQPPAEAEPARRMVRIEHPNKLPVVTYAIMGVTILVFLLQQLSNTNPLHAYLLGLNRMVFGDQILQQLISLGWGGDLLVLLGGMNVNFIKEGQVWRFITPALLHFGLAHVGTNMYSLFILGPALERYYGRGRFLGLYVLCAFGGNLLSFYMSKPQSISAGASTAIFGLIAAEGIFIFQNRALFGDRARSMINNVIFLIVLNLVIGVTFQFDNWGHLGGLITGAVFSWFAGPQLHVEQTVTGFTLVDQRAPAMTWLAWFVLAVLLAGLAFLGLVRT